MSPPPLCLLVDNGSKRAAATLGLRRLAQALSESLQAPVLPVSLLHSDAVPAAELDGSPAEVLLSAVPKYYRLGHHHQLILPLFFGPSGALTWYLPERAQELKRQCPALNLQLAPPLVDVAQGDDNGVVAILADHIRQQLLRCQSLPSVVLVDHGSPEPSVTAVRNFLAQRLQEALADEVERVVAASMERREGEQYAFNEPLLAHVFERYGLNAGEVVIAMQFLLPGRHAGEGGDVAEILADATAGLEQLHLHITPLVGEHPALIESLVRRYRQGLSADPL